MPSDSVQSEKSVERPKHQIDEDEASYRVERTLPRIPSELKGNSTFMTQEEDQPLVAPILTENTDVQGEV